MCQFQDPENAEQAEDANDHDVVRGRKETDEAGQNRQQIDNAGEAPCILEGAPHTGQAREIFDREKPGECPFQTAQEQPCAACTGRMLSSITTATLPQIAISRPTSKAFPAGVSLSKITVKSDRLHAGSPAVGRSWAAGRVLMVREKEIYLGRNAAPTAQSRNHLARNASPGSCPAGADTGEQRPAFLVHGFPPKATKSSRFIRPIQRGLRGGQTLPQIGSGDGRWFPYFSFFVRHVLLPRLGGGKAEVGGSRKISRN